MHRKQRQETLDGKEEEPNEGGLAEREGRKDPTRTAECVNMVNEPNRVYAHVRVRPHCSLLITFGFE